MNERLLYDGCEARALAFGSTGSPSSPTVAAWLGFIRHPTAVSWYRADNMSVVSAYLEHEHLASRESRVERFFINLVLIRVLYTYALVARPRLALGWLAFAGRPLGDPRVGMTGIFLSLSRVLPDRYPLGDDLAPYLRAEHGIGHLLDVGVIQPRLESLYDWSARELAIPTLRQLLDGQTPLLRMAGARRAAVAPGAVTAGSACPQADARDAPCGLMSARAASWMGCMQLPQGVARFNRHVTNPIQRMWAGWAPTFAIIEHVGRRSGKPYRTPVSVFSAEVDGKPGAAVLPTYGPDRDWLKNLKAAGGGQMRRYGKTFGIADPQVISKAEAATHVVRGQGVFARLPFEQAVLFTRTG